MILKGRPAIHCCDQVQLDLLLAFLMRKPCHCFLHCLCRYPLFFFFVLFRFVFCFPSNMVAKNSLSLHNTNCKALPCFLIAKTCLCSHWKRPYAKKSTVAFVPHIAFLFLPLGRSSHKESPYFVLRGGSTYCYNSITFPKYTKRQRTPS